MISAALDTSHGASLAVAQGPEVVYCDALPYRRRESDRDLSAWVCAGFRACGTEAASVARWTVGTGPGSFSGIRAGIALIRGICAVSGALCRGVPSSVALALTATAGESTCRVGVLHDARCGQLILTRFIWDCPVLRPLGEAGAQDPRALTREDLCCDLYVTAQADEVLPLLPRELHDKTVTRPTPDARHLLDSPGWGWPESAPAGEVSLEPVYVRPAVFVSARPSPATPSP